MYPGGRADARARRLSMLWATVFGLGLGPRRWVSLEVTGRKSGRIVRFPLGMADLDGQWYLVSMLGEHCNWVLNVRAAGGRAVIRHGRAVALPARRGAAGRAPRDPAPLPAEGAGRPPAHPGQPARARG